MFVINYGLFTKYLFLLLNTMAAYIFTIYLITALHVSQSVYQRDRSWIVENGNENSTYIVKKALYRTSYILSTKLQEAVKNELGSVNFQNHESPGTEAAFTSEDIVSSMSEKLDAKLATAFNLLLNIKKYILNSTHIPSFTHPCPLSSIRKTSRTNSFSKYYMLPKERSSFILNNDKKLTYEWSGNYKDLKIKRRYFLSKVDSALDKDCSIVPQSNLRQLYHRVYYPTVKNVIIVLDNSMGYRHFQRALLIIQETVNILQNTDRVALITTSDNEFIEFEDSCIQAYTILGNATDENKVFLYEHISRLHSLNGPTNITQSMKKILASLPKPGANESSLIVFLSEKMKLMHDDLQFVEQNVTYVNKEKNAIMNFVVCILRDEFNYYADLMTGTATVSEKRDQIYFLSFNSSSTPEDISSIIYKNLPTREINNEILSMPPYWDPTELDFIISFLLPAGKQGVLGIDLYLTDIAEDIVYFVKQSNNKQRVFLMDMNGKVLMHSYFPRPEVSLEKIKFTDLKYIENHEEIMYVKNQMMSNAIGNLSVTLKEKINLIYTWKWIKNIYVICVVIEGNNVSLRKDNTEIYSSRIPRDLLYHRLDLYPSYEQNLCRHFKQIATIEKGTFYLSPTSFNSPFSYLHDIKEGKDAAIKSMQTNLAYLKDTGILTNPGILKNEIPNDVGLLHSILTYFKHQHIHGPYNKYVVRRYAATESGVLVMFPGTVLEHDYVPTRRPWYNMAVERSRRVILTPPSLDVGGAGYVVSISYALQHSSDYPFMVLSMDVTMGFLYKMLLDAFPQCDLHNIKCFIMDNRGYLISHPDLMDPNNSGPIEQQHITHKESLIASDMLNNKNFVQKRVCNNFADRTVQRFYEFNTSLSTVLTNVVHGDHCIQYFITAIPGTNAFVSIINSTCEGGAAFCPCSMYDRLCLNCNSMEQNTCECPCECSFKSDECDKIENVNASYESALCSIQPEKNQHKSHYFYTSAANLKPCFNFDCETYVNHSSCLGILGCEWCQVDADGNSLLPSPFCTAQSSCFNGVLGSVTPYGEGTYGHVTSEDITGSYYAIGPVAGSIVTVCLIIAIAIYCYRQNSSTPICRDFYADEHIDNWADPDLQLSHLQSDDNAHGDHSGQDKLLPAMDYDAPISPYKVLTGYRRPNNTGDSDHGYSTMTPHEDSEHMAFAMTEPFASLDESSTIAKSEMHSKCSGDMKNHNSPKENGLDFSTTVLPNGKNSVIVPVTVHRHMEAS